QAQNPPPAARLAGGIAGAQARTAPHRVAARALAPGPTRRHAPFGGRAFRRGAQGDADERRCRALRRGTQSGADQSATSQVARRVTLIERGAWVAPRCSAAPRNPLDRGRVASAELLNQGRFICIPSFSPLPAHSL